MCTDLDKRPQPVERIRCRKDAPIPPCAFFHHLFQAFSLLENVPLNFGDLHGVGRAIDDRPGPLKGSCEDLSGGDDSGEQVSLEEE